VESLQLVLTSLVFASFCCHRFLFTVFVTSDCFVAWVKLRRDVLFLLFFNLSLSHTHTHTHTQTHTRTKKNMNFKKFFYHFRKVCLGICQRIKSFFECLTIFYFSTKSICFLNLFRLGPSFKLRDIVFHDKKS
jgi:hypothetical protein